jgi:hypothetical protein
MTLALAFIAACSDSAGLPQLGNGGTSGNGGTGGDAAGDAGAVPPLPAGEPDLIIVRCMSSISSMALSGMQAATAQFQSSASKIANPNSGADLADQIVQQAAAQSNVSIQLQMIRAEQDLTQALVDILV